MMLESDPSTASTNRNAIISCAAGLLSLIALCIALIPIPFTGYVCFPAAAVLGIVGVVTGLKARHQIRLRGEEGGTLAAIGLGLGTAAILAAICAAILGFLIWSRIAEAVHLLAH
jgi:hypothetical protein